VKILYTTWLFHQIYGYKKINWSITNGRETTFVPKSVRAIAILFFAISKFGETARHLPQQGNEAHISSAQVNPWKEMHRNQVQGPAQVQKEKIKGQQAVRHTVY